MKKNLLIAFFAIMIFAVEGYAQRRDERGGSSRGSARVEQRHNAGISRATAARGSAYTRTPASPNRETSYQRGDSPSRQSRSSVSATSRSNGTNVTPSRRSTRTEASRSDRGNSAQQRNSGNYPGRNAAPALQHQRHSPSHSQHHNNYGRWAPTFHHHSRYHHHHYNCLFDSWYWFTWGGYHNRFICHRRYHDRYFDSLLGYYLWGAFDAPTRRDSGNMTFTRYNSTLKVKIGNNYSYLDLYRYQRIVYNVGFTTVEVTTNFGYATIYFYDDYGNTATYRL